MLKNAFLSQCKQIFARQDIIENIKMLNEFE